MMKCQCKNTKRHMFTHPSASVSIPPDVPVASVEPEDSVQTMSTRRITFKRPPNPLDRAKPPKRTRGDDDDDHSALLSACQHDLERVSENLKDGKSVFSGIGMPDMSDWLAIKIKAETSKVETSTEAKSVEPLQKDVDIFLITVSFSLDEEIIQQICSNPDPCLWTFRDENGVIHALCLVYVDDFMFACSDSQFGKHVFDSINHLFEWGKWESRVFKQCGAHWNAGRI